MNCIILVSFPNSRSGTPSTKLRFDPRTAGGGRLDSEYAKRSFAKVRSQTGVWERGAKAGLAHRHLPVAFFQHVDNARHEDGHVAVVARGAVQLQFYIGSQ